MKLPVVTVTARTGGDPVLTYLNDGTALCTVRVAWSQDRPPAMEGGEWARERTTWATVEWWGRAAEHTADLNIGTGDLIRVTGALWMDEYTRRDGTPGQGLKLRADGTPRVWAAQRNRPAAPAAAPQTAPAEGPSAGTPAPASRPVTNTMTGGRHDDPPF